MFAGNSLPGASVSPAGRANSSGSGSSGGGDASVPGIRPAEASDEPGETPGMADSAAGTPTTDGTFDDDGRNEDSADPSFESVSGDTSGWEAVSGSSRGTAPQDDDGTPSASGGARYTPPANRPPQSLDDVSPQQIRTMALSAEGVQEFRRLAKKTALFKLKEENPEKWNAITSSSEQRISNGKRAAALDGIVKGLQKDQVNSALSKRLAEEAKFYESIRLGTEGAGREGNGPAVQLGDSGIRT